MKKLITLTVLALVVVTAIFSTTLTDVIQTVDSQRIDLLQSNKYVSAFKSNYASFNPDYAKSITAEEAKSLMTYRDRKSSVSYEEAVSDVDLYFRLLRYRMGHYDILGGDEVFYKVRDRVLDKLLAYKDKTVSTSFISKSIIEELGFIDDCHFNIDGCQVYYDNNTYTLKHVTYLSGYNFTQDEIGYYFIKGSTKYYYQSCDCKSASLVPMISDNGNIIYSLVLYSAPANKPYMSKVLLKSDTGLTKEYFFWREIPGTPVNNGFVYKEIDNIAYVGMTGCSTEVEGSLYTFGRKAREKDVVIIDLRSNGGTHGYEFLRGYTDNQVSLNEVALCRVGMTNSDCLEPGSERVDILSVSGSGSISKSDNLTIVLVDNNTGCAPEEFSQYFRFITNSVIIGTNTMGHLDGGTTTYGNPDSNKYNQIQLYLPNTGIPVQVSTNLALYGDYESMVGKGFLPDIYVNNTTNAIKFVSSLLEYNGIITEETAKSLIAKSTESVPIPLYDSEKAVQVVKCESIYGTYYEARMTLGPDNTIGCFVWPNPDTSQKYKIEIISSAVDNVVIDIAMTQKNHTNTGCDLVPGLVRTCEPYVWNSETIYGLSSIRNGEISETIEVAFRFIPTDNNEVIHWTSFYTTKGNMDFFSDTQKLGKKSN